MTFSFLPPSLVALLALGSLAAPLSSQAQQTVCAKVSLEISQEVTLARQAFEARMVITNSLPTDITDVAVELKFADDAGAPVSSTDNVAAETEPYFFYRKEISGKDTTAAAPHPLVIHSKDEVALIWTLIPTVTAANAGTPSPNGRVYQIGAQLTYVTGKTETLPGKTEVVPINPDFIRVKPLPKIRLDYFLPLDVSGDNPLTLIEEPAVPFLLGVRALNTGEGTARQFTIESKQPKVVNDAQGTDVAITLHSASVNDATVPPQAVVNAGDIAPNSSAMIAWEMRSSYSGRFSTFSALASHSDELGGALTALVRPEIIPTHALEGMVVVNLPGCDGIGDFLAWDSFSKPTSVACVPPSTSTLFVFESRNVNRFDPEDIGTSVVSNFRLDAPVVSNVISFGDLTPSSQAFCYLRGIDSKAGTQPIKRVVRLPEGKVLPARNAWLSRRYYVPTGGATPVTEYNVHVFDWLPAGTTGVSWRIEYDTAPTFNRPPVIAPLANRIIPHHKQVCFTVTASDPDGNPDSQGHLVEISLPIRPYGSTYTVYDGSLTFKWTPGGPASTPGPAQTGDFALTFKASDGLLTTTRAMVLTVQEGSLLDKWKERWWPSTDTVNSAADADPDGDGLTNLYEYALDLDPTRSSTNQRPVLSHVTDTYGTHLALTATYRTDDDSLRVQMLTSNDPSFPAGSSTTAVTTGTTENEATTPPGFICTRFVDATPLSTTGRRFVRLQVVPKP